MKFQVTTLIITSAASILQGCQCYIKHDISVRNATTCEPVQVSVEVGYDLSEQLARAFTLFSPRLKRYETTTDECGNAIIRVAPDVRWFVLLKKDDTFEAVRFNSDSSVNHTFGRVREQNGWLLTQMFADPRTAAPGEHGTLEVMISRIDR